MLALWDLTGLGIKAPEASAAPEVEDSEAAAEESSASDNGSAAMVSAEQAAAELRKNLEGHSGFCIPAGQESKTIFAQGAAALVRVKSAVLTGGIGNWVIATLELKSETWLLISCA